MDRKTSTYIGAVNELHGRRLTLFFGLTGAGKSTLLNGLLNADNLDFDDEDGYVVPENQLLVHNGRKMFAISDGLTSCTKKPCFWPVADGHYFVDCAGAADTVNENEFPNITTLHHMLKNAETATLVLVITGSDLTSERGRCMLIIATAATRLLALGKMDLEEAILPVLNNAGIIRTKS